MILIDLLWAMGAVWVGSAPGSAEPTVTQILPITVRFACAPAAEESIDLLPGMQASVRVPNGCQSAGELLKLTLACNEQSCRGTVTTEFGRSATLGGPRARVVAGGPEASRSLLLAGLQISAQAAREVPIDVSLLARRKLKIKVQASPQSAAFVVVAPGELQRLELASGGGRLELGVRARWLDVDRVKVTLVRSKGVLIQRIMRAGEPLSIDCHNSPLPCPQSLTVTVTAPAD